MLSCVDVVRDEEAAWVPLIPHFSAAGHPTVAGLVTRPSDFCPLAVVPTDLSPVAADAAVAAAVNKYYIAPTCL